MRSTAGRRSWLAVVAVAVVAVATLAHPGGTAAAATVDTVPPVFERAWGTPTVGAGELIEPVGLANGASSLYVVDAGQDAVLRFSRNGTYYGRFGTSGEGPGEFSSPADVAVDGTGNVYVTDSANDRVQKFTAAGTYVTEWGSLGTAAGRFDGPAGIAVDGAGDVYVVDSGNDRVQKFHADGTYVTKWGAYGQANARFDGPKGIAVDSANRVFVTDAGNDRVQRFSSAGVWQASIGSTGSGSRQFVSPAGVEVDSADNLFVVDSGNDRVQRYDAGGTLTKVFGARGTGNNRFWGPTGITVDASDNIYVADTGNRRIEKYTAASAASSTVYSAQWGTVAGPGEFAGPTSVATDAAGNVYVLDPADHRVQRFTSSGGYLTQWGGLGTTSGKFDDLAGLAVSSADKVYVGDTVYDPATDSVYGRVQVFTAGGSVLTPLGTTGQFEPIEALAVDPTGNVHVADRVYDAATDTEHIRMQVFNAGGTRIRTWNPGGGIEVVDALSTDSAGNAYLADSVIDAGAGTVHGRIQVFGPTGTLLRTLGADGSLVPVSALATDTDGTLYLDQGDEVQRRSGIGALRASWGGPGSGNGEFAMIGGLALDAARNLYVTDVGNTRVQRFVPATGVAGTVREASGAAVAGAWVLALRTTDFSVAGGVATDDQGGYTLLVPAGTYFLYLLDPSGAHRSGFAGAPDQFTVAAATVLQADATMAATLGSVGGTISGVATPPIAGTWAISLSTATNAPEAAVLAGSSGRYLVPNLTPGGHRVAFIDPNGSHRTTFYVDAPDVTGSTPVTVSAGATTTADAALPAQGVLPGTTSLGGTVRETGTNTPLAGVRVIALTAASYRMTRGVITNPSGAWTMSVPAGSYRLAYVDGTGRHAMEWHDNHPYTDLALADAVTAPATVNATLDPLTGSVRGRVTADGTSQALAGLWVLAIGPTGPAGGTSTAADGSYTLGALAPGTYRVAVIDPSGARAITYWNHRTDYQTADPVAVTAGTAATADVGVP